MSAETLIDRLDALWLEMNDALAEPPATARILNALHDAAQALRTTPAPMEAVVWRWEQWSNLTSAWIVRFTHERPLDGPRVRNIQPLYTHPPQPDALPGDLRERVRRLIKDWPFHTEEQDRADELADAILSLIQSEHT